MKVKINILGVGFDDLTIDEANNKIVDYIKNNKRSIYVVKPYVEFLVKANRDEQIKKQLNNADLVLADGVSIQWAASYLYGQPKTKFLKLIRSLIFWLQDKSWRSQIIPEKMAGINQTIKLLDLANKNALKIGVIGGKSSPQEIQLYLQNRFKNLSKVKCWSGYFNKTDEAKIVDEIKKAKLDILFVAMGFPRQENFIVKNINSNIAKVSIGEGGSFDYDKLGGSIKRAPESMQRTGLEWLWRLGQQPSRVIRQLSIVKYVILVYKQAKSTK